MGFSYVKPLPIADRSFTPDADKTHERQPKGGTDATGQTPGDQHPTTAQGGNFTLTLAGCYQPRVHRCGQHGTLVR
jgi:hypothetical protein